MIKGAKKEEVDYATDFLTTFNYATEAIYSDSRKPSMTIKPSSVKCARASVYQCLGAEPDKAKSSNILIYICENGSRMHEFTQSIATHLTEFSKHWEFEDLSKYIIDNNIDLKIKKPCDFKNGDYETKLYSKKYNVSFLADGLLSYVDNDGNKKYFILEIKTCSDRGFYKQSEVMEKHKQQGIAYCTLLHVNSVLFFYIERNIMSKKTFLFTPSKEEKANFISKLNMINDCTAKNVVPAKPIEADAKFCQYCNYKSTCRRGGTKAYCLQ